MSYVIRRLPVTNMMSGAVPGFAARSLTHFTYDQNRHDDYLLGGRGKLYLWSSFPCHVTLLSFVFPSKPIVMPRINIPPAMMTGVKEAMTSTSEKILRLRLAHCLALSLW